MPTEHDQKHNDVNVSAIFASGLGLIAITAASMFAVWLLFVFFNGHGTATGSLQYPLASGQENRLPPEPRLQVNPREDLREMRAKEDALLNGYSWVDQNAGVVRIPVSEAMRLAVERGLPTRATAAREDGGK